MKRMITENCCRAVVEEISWERIFMTLTVHVDYPENPTPEVPLVFYAVNGDFLAKARFKQEQTDEHTWRLRLNITNQGENRCVPKGTYRLAVCQGTRVLAECETAESLISHLDEDSRNFLYGGRNAVYTVTFFVEEGEETLPFRMLLMASKREGIGVSTKGYQPVRKPRRLRKYVDENRRPVLRSLYRHYRNKYRNYKNVILFMSEQSTTLGGNQLAVIKRMKERGLDQEYTILTSARAAAAEGQPRKSWLELIQKLAMSSMVVVDDHAPVLDWLKLDDETEVVQLWHAGAGFKSSGYSRWGHEGCPRPYSAHRQYRFGIAGSKAIAPFFSEVWGINDEQVLPTGMPRMDEYLDPVYREQKVKELYRQFPLSEGKKVILFAPTYRGRNKRTAYYPYQLIDFDELYRVCGDEYVVFFKMHPWVSTSVPIPDGYRDRFVDVNHYPNINDLFYITDLLITDYSSNIFEYSLMRKPMLFFAFDKIQYSFSRGFHRDYEASAPGKICYHFDEVLEAIRNQDFEAWKVDEYVKYHFDYIDTHSSDRVIDWIIRGELPEEIREELKAVEDANAAMNEMVFEYLDDNAAEEDGDDNADAGEDGSAEAAADTE